MKKLHIILALACSFTTSTHAVAQAKAAPRAVGTVFRDCRACRMVAEFAEVGDRKIVWLRRPDTNLGISH